MEFKYVIVQKEYTNVGIIFQSDNRMAVKFKEGILPEQLTFTQMCYAESNTKTFDTALSDLCKMLIPC